MRTEKNVQPRDLVGLDERQLLDLLLTQILVIEGEWARLGRVQRQRVCREARMIVGELKRRGSQLRMC